MLRFYRSLVHYKLVLASHTLEKIKKKHNNVRNPYRGSNLCNRYVYGAISLSDYCVICETYARQCRNHRHTSVKLIRVVATQDVSEMYPCLSGNIPLFIKCSNSIHF